MLEEEALLTEGILAKDLPPTRFDPVMGIAYEKFQIETDAFTWEGLNSKDTGERISYLLTWVWQMGMNLFASINELYLLTEASSHDIEIIQLNVLRTLWRSMKITDDDFESAKKHLYGRQ